MSNAVGKLSERILPPAVSRAITGAYIRAYGVDMTDVDPGSGAYPNFDSFFTRELRKGARIIADDAVVSPADGLLVARGPVDAQSTCLVKGKPYGSAELIGDERDAADFAGGSFAVVYLSPRDYHRVHCPVDGHLYRVKGISGDLYPVNSIGERHVPNLFVKNQRVSMFIDMGKRGRAVVVMVGAMIVGRISVRALPTRQTPLGDHRLDPAVPVRRGDEIGTFHLGSTVVMLLPPGTTLGRATGPVRYGESLLSE